MRIDWAAMDAWFEEDEEVIVHPRDPAGAHRHPAQLAPRRRQRRRGGRRRLDAPDVPPRDRPADAHLPAEGRRADGPADADRRRRPGARTRAGPSTGRCACPTAASTPTSRGATRRRCASRTPSPASWRSTTPRSTSRSTAWRSPARRADADRAPAPPPGTARTPCSRAVRDPPLRERDVVCDNHTDVITAVCRRTDGPHGTTRQGGPPTCTKLSNPSPDPGDHGWQDDANCLGVDPDLFFPERGASTARGQGGLPRLRRARGVPGVRAAERREVRHLGRPPERERRRIRRQRAQAARSVLGA